MRSKVLFGIVFAIGLVACGSKTTVNPSTTLPAPTVQTAIASTTTAAPTTSTTVALVLPPAVTEALTSLDPSNLLAPIRACFNSNFPARLGQSSLNNPKLLAQIAQATAHTCGLTVEVLVNPTSGASELAKP